LKDNRDKKPTTRKHISVMRTAIFLGLTAIADAIRKDWLEDSTVGIAAIALLIMMDIAEFVNKMRHDNSCKKNKAQ
jgi:hypothetical protein